MPSLSVPLLAARRSAGALDGKHAYCAHMATQIDWAALSHAYGSAEDVPDLLRRVVLDRRPGHVPGSPWFELWSALCHQGDVFSASYAAVPLLTEIARLPQYQGRNDPIVLAGCIELARLEGRGPAMPADLELSYRLSLIEGRRIAAEGARLATDQDTQVAYKGSAAAFAGDCQEARRLLDEDTPSAV